MEPLLEVRGLTLGYRAPLVKDISFSLMPGEMVGILGRNGCGKTTLLRGIAGGARRYSGEVLLGGKECRGMSQKERARRMAILPQQTWILEGITAREVLAMGLYPHGSAFLTRVDEDRIREAAAVFGVEEKLEEDCARLSQGQRQMVLLAEILVQDAPVLLLDEPDTALDYDNTYTMFDSVRTLVDQKKKGALLVLHDPEQALRWCDRLLLLKNGEQVGVISTKKTDAPAVESALRELYPKIRVWEDPRTGGFRCDTEREYLGGPTCRRK